MRIALETGAEDYFAVIQSGGYRHKLAVILRTKVLDIKRWPWPEQSNLLDRPANPQLE